MKKRRALSDRLFLVAALAMGLAISSCGGEESQSQQAGTAPSAAPAASPTLAPRPSPTAPASPTVSPSASPTPYAPCAGKAPGDICTICDPNAADCIETRVLKRCDPQGECKPGSEIQVR